MTHRSPLLTLTAVAAYFVVLLVANYIVNPGGAASVSATPGTTAPTVSATAGTYPSKSAAPPSVAASPGTSVAAEPSTSAEDDAFPHKAVYVDRTSDRSLAVAVAVLGDKAAAYICDGRSREAWLRGTVDGDEVTLTSRNGYRIRAELDDDGRLEGTIARNGRRWKFDLKVAEPPAGLYRGKGSKTTIGWIRLSDGSLVGVATDEQGAGVPAPVLPPHDVVEVDGERIHARAVDGDANL